MRGGWGCVFIVNKIFVFALPKPPLNKADKTDKVYLFKQDITNQRNVNNERGLGVCIYSVQNLRLRTT